MKVQRLLLLLLLLDLSGDLLLIIEIVAFVDDGRHEGHGGKIK